MMCWFYSEVVRSYDSDRDRTYAVRLWRIEDWFNPELNVKSIDSITPSVVFPCDSLHEAELLQRRLITLRDVMEGTHHASV